jgi:hypothetical protein
MLDVEEEQLFLLMLFTMHDDRSGEDRSPLDLTAMGRLEKDRNGEVASPTEMTTAFIFSGWSRSSMTVPVMESPSNQTGRPAPPDVRLRR